MAQYKSSLLNWKSKCSTFDYISLSSLKVSGMAELANAGSIVRLQECSENPEYLCLQVRILLPQRGL